MHASISFMSSLLANGRRSVAGSTTSPSFGKVFNCVFGRVSSFRMLGTATTTKVVRLAGVEPATLGLEVRCSILLSYRRVLIN